MSNDELGQAASAFMAQHIGRSIEHRSASAEMRRRERLTKMVNKLRDEFDQKGSIRRGLVDEIERKERAIARIDAAEYTRP